MSGQYKRNRPGEVRRFAVACRLRNPDDDRETRLPIAPLLAKIDREGLTNPVAAARCGVSNLTMFGWRTGEVTHLNVYEADHVGTAFAEHPCRVWIDWWELTGVAVEDFDDVWIEVGA